MSPPPRTQTPVPHDRRPELHRRHEDRPDPRDACVEALRLARAALDVSTTHRPEDREKVVAARIATERALRALDGEQS